MRTLSVLFVFLLLGQSTSPVSGLVCFLLYLKVFGILVPQPGIEPIPPAVEARSLNC